MSGNAPVEVGLDMKRVEVRPYGVSKGAAMTTILERIVGPVNRRIAEETAEGDSAGSSPSANKPAEFAEGAPAEGGAERPTPPLPQALAGVSASMPPNSAEKSSRVRAGPEQERAHNIARSYVPHRLDWF